MPVSQAIRNQIIALKMHTSKSDREISEDLSIDHRTVARIWNKYQETGSIRPYQGVKMGKPCKLSVREKALIVREAKKDPKASAEEVKNAVGEVGRKVSTRTVKRIISAGGLKAYRPVRKPLLTAKHKKPAFNGLDNTSNGQWMIGKK